MSEPSAESLGVRAILVRAGVVAYALGAVIAYGHFAAKPCPPEILWGACQERAIIGSMGVAMFWPLYLSYELQVSHDQ